MELVDIIVRMHLSVICLNGLGEGRADSPHKSEIKVKTRERERERERERFRDRIKEKD